MKNFKNILLAAGVLLLCSCGNRSAQIDCTIAQAPESDIVVKLLNVNKYEILDTVRTNAAGRFSYKMKFKSPFPEFVYLFHNDRQIAALLLQAKEKAVVEADTLGNYSIAGSPESVRLMEIDKAYAEFITKMNSLSDRIDALGEDSKEAEPLVKERLDVYVNYYRDRTKYVMGNPKSLTAVPVLFQTFGNDMPVFSQQTDAVFYNLVCDSLETVYPGSPYVRSLRAEGTRRFADMKMAQKIAQAEEISYVDMEIPDVNGVKRKLSEVDAKVVLVHFWSSSNALQKMFNLEVLKPAYDSYKGKGLEIYQVAIDNNKASWARIVKDQNLDWINVCDGLGEASPVIKSYYITQYPVSYLLIDGNLYEAKFSTLNELNALLKKYL